MRIYKRTNLSIDKIFMISLSIILILGNLTMTNSSRITTMLCFIAFPFLSINELAVVLCFLVPVNSGITGSYVFPYILVLMVAKETISSNKKIKITSELVFILMLWIYELAMGMFYGEIKYRELLLYISMVYFMFHLINKGDLNFKACCIAFIMGTSLLLLGVMLLALQSGQTLLNLGLQYDNRLGIAFATQVNTALLSDNANNLAYYSIVSLSMIFLLFAKESFRNRICLAVLMVINLVIGMFTVSRTWMLMLGVTIILVTIFGDSMKSRLKFLIVGGIIGYICLLFIIEKTSLLDAIMIRFELFDIKDNTRIDLMNEYFQVMNENPSLYFTGTGTLQYKNVYRCSNSVHNGLQQLLVCYGIIGATWFIVEMVKPICKYARQGHLKFYKLIPFVVGTMFIQSIQLVNPCVLMIPLMVGILFMKIPEVDSNENNSNLTVLNNGGR